MTPIALTCAYLSDILFGDPEWFPHPVRGMGWMVRKLEKRTNGILLAVIVVGASVFFAGLFVYFMRKIHPFLGTLASVYLGYTALAIKDLRVKAKAILKELEGGSVIRARQELSKIVGRDTKSLDEKGIAQAAIESIAENTSDGIIAPLFYLIIGGPILGIAYKAINTLDSMVGYKNEKYAQLGRFSAKLDDVANFVPARVTGVLIALASLSRNAFRVMLRDGRKHPSPNSGIPEAAMAGALGKPTDISQALRISGIASFIMLLIGIAFKWAI